MSVHEYSKILTRAKQIKKGVLETYEIKYNLAWSYFFAKSILNPKKDIKKIKIDQAKSNNTGDYFSRQVSNHQFTDMAKRFVKYVEEHHQLPTHITVSPNRKMCVNDYLFMFARLVIFQDKYGRLPNTINVNSKYLIKPTETHNVVYDYFVQKTGITPKYLDDVCDWVKDKVTYLFYFDDQESNKEVIDNREGNCTDLLQFLVNMAEALGYDWEVIHTECMQSGTGHVYGRFKKKGTNNWFTRDIACIANNSDYCVWCEVPDAGNLLAKNPDWFLENLHR